MPRQTKAEKEREKKIREEKAEALRRKKRIKDEIIAIVIIAVGLFLVFSLLTGTTGAVGVAVKAFLGGLLGWVAYILPFFLIVYGVLVFARKTSLVTVGSLIEMIVLFVLLTCLIANFKVPLKGSASYDFSMSLKSIYAMGTEGGGIVGVYAGGFIKNLIGEMGLYLVSALGIIICLMFILNTPLSTLVDNARLHAKARKQAREEARAEREQIEDIARQRDEETERIKAEEAKKEQEKQDKAKAAAAIASVASRTPREIQERVDTDSLPKLNMDSIEGFDAHTQPEDDIVSELPPVPAGSTSRFTPEDIGLKTPKNHLVIEGITENQQNVLDMVMDDDLFSKGAKDNKASVRDIRQTASERPQNNEEPAVKPDSSDKPVTAPKTDTKTDEHKSSSNYVYPPIKLLNKPSGLRGSSTGPNIQDQAELLEDTLHSFGVAASVVDVIKGPAVTRFEVQPATGVKVSKIASLHDDLALNLRAKSLRIEAPIPGKAAVGIEVSNDTISTVTLREIIESEEFQKSKSKITVAIGRSIGGEAIVADLKSMPHLLVAGSTGSGKSVCINSMIISLLYKAAPEEVKLILIDPKVVELSIYNGLPHLMIPVVTDAAKASAALGWAVSEMNDRYNKFAAESVRDLQSYNETVRANGEEDKVLPQIVIIIDELAELIMTAKNTVEDSICRIAQKARAAGMHLIVATQRPSTDVITGVIKANIPSRIAFAVSSQTDSRVILDVGGAENLLGKGDMLYGPQSISKPLRVQGCFISDNEVRDVIDFVKGQYTMANYNEDIIHAMNNAGISAGASSEEDGEDELLKDAIETVVRAEQCSVSMLQRRFRIGYNRAARLVELMEERGIVGPPDGARPRKVNMTLAEFQSLEELANSGSSGVEEEIGF
ncbi:MAG: DNA translocase FtsK [Clostridia bacterium]|nr:DNA translocase FtsK [Clostridia bacterium]